MRRLSPSLALALLWSLAAVAAEPDAARLYRDYCASCHGAERLGGSGPALLPEVLGRLTPQKAAEVIARGRPATMMPAFASLLDAAQIRSLADYIFTPPETPPRWGAEEIRRSRRRFVEDSALPEKPVFAADPLNLFVLVEKGDHHVSILDGDRFARLARFATSRALHGGPKFSPDGRFVYFASRDGWIEKYDLWSLQKVLKVRAGINTRNLAVSHDGRILAVANYLPSTLVLLDAASFEPLEVREVRSAQGKPSRISAVYQARPRRSFILALKDAPELWEIGYSDPLPHQFAPFAHSYELGQEEALPPDTRFPVRRIFLEEPIDDFFFDPSYRHLIGAARESDHAVVVHLDVGRIIARIPMGGMPHLASGITFRSGGRRLFATPHLREPVITVVDMQSWKVVKRIRTLGPGFFARSHENSPYFWVDVFFGPHRDALHVIDKERLEIVKTLTPSPGRTAAHVEFDRDGRHALVSIWEDDGAVVVYDARSLEEVRRIRARRPSGKYNVWNKISLSEGTSH